VTLRRRPVDRIGGFSLQTQRLPGRSKRGSAYQGPWLYGIPPICGGDGRTEGDGEQQGEKPQEGNGTPADKAKPDERAFSQADVDRIVAERLQREQAKATQAAEKAKREAEELAATQQGEFKTLAEQRQQRIAALEQQVAEVETQKARADKYEAALKQHLDAQRKDLPKHILELLDDKDPADQLSWLSKNAEQLGTTARPGIGPTPRPSGNPAADRIQENRQKLQASGSYARF
jgi:hypothetical protein